MTDSAVIGEVTSAEAVPQVNPNKVFAGNLSFSSTEADLTKLFSQAGTVTSAQIITRGARPVGYGFVTFSTPEEAQKAISLLHDQDVDGRKLSVALAKPDASKPKSKPRAKAAANGEEGEGAEEKEGEEGAGRGHGARGRGRGRGGRGRGRGGRFGARRARNDQGEDGGEGASSKPARPPRETSKTQVFVGRLPLEVTEEQVKSAFTGFSVQKIEVLKAIVNGRNAKPRSSYALVDVGSEAEQQRALSELKDKSIAEQPFTIKVAFENTKHQVVANEAAEVAQSTVAGAA